MAEFTACYAGAQAVIADTDRVVFEGIRKIVVSFGHSSYENTDAFVRTETCNVIADSDNLCLKRESDFATVMRQVVCDRVLDDFKKLLLGGRRSDRQAMQ